MVVGQGYTEYRPRISRLPGKERDAETGLDYFGARYFSAAQGRWTSPDWSATPQPIPDADLSDPQTLNLYSYVRNNPLSHADIDGHIDCNGNNAQLIGCVAIADWNAAHGIGEKVKAATSTGSKCLALGMVLFAETGGGEETPAVAEAAEGVEAAASKAITATEQGIAEIEAHLSQFGPWAPNSAMIGRLKDALAKGGLLSGADANFYLHELAESAMMKAGQKWEVAHPAALAKYGHSPYSLCAPDVVKAFTQVFNANWRNFWGIE